MIALKKLREHMDKEGIDVYVHKNTDPHNSEYLSEHFLFIKYLSGFSGSNATIVVTQTEAGLWTDGRYFIQAKAEIADSGFRLYKLNVAGEPTVLEFIKSHLKPEEGLGLDGRLFSCDEVKKYGKAISGSVKTDCFFMDEIWEDRPALITKTVKTLGTEYTGKSSTEKIELLRKKLNKAGAEAIVLNDLCEIAWLLNLRGDDIPFVPVFFSYMYVSMTEVIVFCGEDAVSDEIQKALNINMVLPLEDFYNFLFEVKENRILLDPDVSNYSIKSALKDKEIIYKASPVILLKAVKNDVEIKNLHKAHLSESLVITRLIYSLKNKWEEYTKWDEIYISDKLKEMRKETNDYVEDSFETIAAYGANAAMMHYSPKIENSTVIEPRGFLLIDTGGHYLTGTTDTTRTVAMGDLSEIQKEHYTLVLKAHLKLMNAKFPKGVSGENLDVLSRSVFWERGLDYLSGTGHGVGYLLSVHEGPNSIRWRYTKKPEPIVPGMVTTDEPGMYVEGEYGIRIENELLCVPYKETEYGEYYAFTPLTLVPYETDAIDISMLNPDEKRILNEYNSLVYEKLLPFLCDEEKLWLKKVTKEV